MEDVQLEQLVADVRALLEPGRRVLLGLTGAPGAGKSTVAEQLVASFDGEAMLVGLDGFHLADDQLRRMGRWECKGAVDTFDAAGYVHLLRRLRARDEPIVYAPRFDRSLEESIGSAVPVPAEVPLIVTEGNYLLVDSGPWAAVRDLLDACWYVEPGEDLRLERLVARHEQFGRSAEEARQRSYGTDQINAELIASTKARADRVIRLV